MLEKKSTIICPHCGEPISVNLDSIQDDFENFESESNDNGIDDFDIEYIDSSNEFFDENIFMDPDIDKENMLDQLRDFYGADEAGVDVNSSYEEIKERVDEMEDEKDIGEDALFPNGRDYDSEDED